MNELKYGKNYVQDKLLLENKILSSTEFRYSRSFLSTIINARKRNIDIIFNSDPCGNHYAIKGQ